MNTLRLFESDFPNDDYVGPDVNIKIEKASLHNDDLRIMVDFKPVPNRITIGDVQGLGDDLVDSADYTITSIVDAGQAIEKWKATLFDATRGAAVTGYNARARLFGNALNAEYVNKRALVTGHTVPVFHIDSDVISLPWGMLYEKSPQAMSELDTYSSLNPFWALQSIVTQPNKSNNSMHMDRWGERPLRMGVVIEDTLEYAQIELEQLIALRDANYQFEIDVFHSTTTNDLQFISELNAFLNKDFHILHFACHASPYAPDHSDAIDENSKRKFVSLQAHLRVCNRRHYLIKHFSQPPSLQIKAPLVFLNACCTGVRNTSQTFHFVGELRKSGAQHLIAIETAMSSHIAQQIALEFYRNFFNGIPLGMALHKAKHSILSRGASSTDVMAMFYSLYANEDLKLIPDLGGNQDGSATD